MRETSESLPSPYSVSECRLDAQDPTQREREIEHLNEDVPSEGLGFKLFVFRRGALVGVVVAFVLLQLPFLTGAIRIDEPNILEIARQISREPLDPYGFSINWLGWSQPAWEVLANPPLVPAWLAIAGSLTNWSESWLRLSMLPFACLALVSFAGIARRFEIAPPVAAVLLACTPAFFLSAHLLMPDVAMLALFLAGVWGALRAEEGSRAGLAAGAAAAFLTPLAKYNGIALIPVLAWLAISASPEARRRLFLLSLMPAAGLGVWSVFGWLQYGEPHVLAVTSHSGGVILSTASFAAITYIGTVLVPWICLAVRIPHVPLKLDIAFSLLMALGVYAKAYSMYYPLVPSILFAVGATLGLRVLVGLLSRTLVEPGERRNLLLLVWIAGPIVLMFRLDFAATRYLLAVTPAAILFLAPRVLAGRHRLIVPVLVLNLLLCVAIAIGDLKIAELSRSFVDERVTELRRETGGQIYFDGHWGFQHYATQAGATLIDKWKRPPMQAGDVWIIVRNASPSYKSIHGKSAPLRLTVERVSPDWPVRTLDYSCRANFYATGIPISTRDMYLPFGFATGTSERFDIYVAEGPTEVRGILP